MKFLLDFLPIVLFFATYKWGEGHSELAAQWMTHYLGFMVSGGVVGVKEAPAMLATVAVAVLSVIQIVVLKVMGKTIDKMLWISLVVVLGLGALTVYFHNPIFIQWKPSVIYWVMGVGIFVSDIVMRRYVLRTMMNADDMNVPEPIWRHLSWAWIAFFAGMGVLNLYVAFNYSESAWVNFKMWGSLGLMLVFTLAQGLYLGHHMPPMEDKPKSGAEGA
jgi:intracellular septation protein